MIDWFTNLNTYQYYKICKYSTNRLRYFFCLVVKNVQEELLAVQVFIENILGFSGIAPTQDCTHLLYIGFMIDWAGLNSYYNSQCIHIQLDKERYFVRKNISFIHKKKCRTLFRKLVQYRVGAIPRLTIFWPFTLI